MRTRVLSLRLHRMPIWKPATAQSLKASSSSLSTQNTEKRTLLVMQFFRMGITVRQCIARAWSVAHASAVCRRVLPEALLLQQPALLDLPKVREPFCYLSAKAMPRAHVAANLSRSRSPCQLGTLCLLNCHGVVPKSTAQPRIHASPLLQSTQDVKQNTCTRQTAYLSPG